MKRKIYTTYLANIKMLPEGVRKIFIARYVPLSLNLVKEKIKHMPGLSPSDSLRDAFKSGIISFDDFIKAYNSEIKNGDFSQLCIAGVASYIDGENKDIALICYEGSEDKCHRYSAANIIKNKVNSECEIIVVDKNFKKENI